MLLLFVATTASGSSSCCRPSCTSAPNHPAMQCGGQRAAADWHVTSGTLAGGLTSADKKMPAVKRPLCAASQMHGMIAQLLHRGTAGESAGGHEVIVLLDDDDDAGPRWRAAHSRGVPACVTGRLVLHGAQPAADACAKRRWKECGRGSGATQRAAGCVMRATPHGVTLNTHSFRQILQRQICIKTTSSCCGTPSIFCTGSNCLKK
jgi:hypothetical protein